MASHSVAAREGLVDVVGGPTGGGFLQGVTQAVSDLKTAAGQGFTVSEQGGQALLTAIQTLQGKVAHHLQKLSALEQRPLPLGTTPAADTYRPFLATVVTDPDHGAGPALKKLQQQLQDAHNAIQKSMVAYQQTDHGSAGTLRSADHSV